MPQEHGNHTKTKVLEMAGGFTFTAETQFDINVSHYTIEAIDKAQHWDELNKDVGTNIRIDYKNSGVGSNSCGPELDEKYRLAEKDIPFNILFTPCIILKFVTHIECKMNIFFCKTIFFVKLRSAGIRAYT